MNRGLDLKIKEKLAGIAIILVVITFILIINLFYKYVNNNNFHMLQSINNLAYNVLNGKEDLTILIAKINKLSLKNMQELLWQ